MLISDNRNRAAVGGLGDFNGQAAMILETLAAIFLLLAALPFWLAVAWAWGLIQFVLWIGIGTVDALTSPYAGWEQVWLVPLAATLQAFTSALSIPSWIWNWAKFEHPWWAFFIALFLSIALNTRRR